MKNCLIESFNGKLRDECLNSELLWNLDDAKRKLAEWRQEYNYTRPHSSLGDVSPAEFAAGWRSNRPGEGNFLKWTTVQSTGRGQHRLCYGKTPMHTCVDGIGLVKEKILAA